MSESQERLVQALIRGVVTAVLAAIASFTPFLLSQEFAQALEAAGVNAVFVPSVVGIATGALSLIAKFLGGATEPARVGRGRTAGGETVERPNVLAV